MADLVALNPGGVATLRPGAQPAPVCYQSFSRLNVVNGYYGSDVACGMVSWPRWGGMGPQCSGSPSAGQQSHMLEGRGGTG